MIIATAPGRCGIVGNPSDMYGGNVISVSTAERARCRIEHSDTLRITSLGVTAEIRSCDDLLPHGDCLDLARSILRYLELAPATARCHISLGSDIPMQAGMAGSTALVVAIAGALDRYFGFGLARNPWLMAETARKIENREMGILCGYQDQHMAVFGGLNYMDFKGKESLLQEPGDPLAMVEPLTSHSVRVPLIAVHTGIRHHSGTVHRAPRDRWLAGEACVVAAFERIAELAREGKKALLAHDWRTLGALMNENHAIVSELGGSGPANDALIEAARNAGAYGAKLAGAGGGGTVVALAHDPERVAQAMMAAGGHLVVRPEPSPGLLVTESPARARTSSSGRRTPATAGRQRQHADLRTLGMRHSGAGPIRVPVARTTEPA